MSGFYAHIEDPLSGEMKKRQIRPMSAKMRRQGLAEQLPMGIDSRKKARTERVETLVFPLDGAHSDVETSRDQVNVIAGLGDNSVSAWLARLAIAGFRLHSSAAEAAFASITQRYQDLIERLLPSLEASGMKSPEFGVIHAYLTKSSPRGANKSLDALERYLGRELGLDADNPALDRLCQALRNRGESWSAFTTEVRADALVEAFDLPIAADKLAEMASGAESSVRSDVFDAHNITKATLSWRMPAVGENNTAMALETLKADTGLYEHALAASASAAGFLGHEKTAKAIDEVEAAFISTGPSFNALSWLLNPRRGLGLFANAEPQLLANHFGAPVVLIEPLVAHARQIMASLDGQLPSPHISRNQIGGTLASFTNRFLDRMVATRSGLESARAVVADATIPSAWSEAQSERLFWNTALRPDTIEAALSSLHDHIDFAHTQTGIFLGEPGAADIENLERALAALRDFASQVRLIINNYRNYQLDAQACADAAQQVEMMGWLERLTPGKALLALGGIEERAIDPENKEPIHAKRGPLDLEHLVRLHPKAAFYADELYRLEADFDRAIKKSTSLIEKLSGQTIMADALLAQYRAQDERHFTLRGQALDDGTLNKRARAHLLQEWFSHWRNLSDEAKQYARQTLLDLNLGHANSKKRWRHVVQEFLFESKGAFFKSIYARRKHNPYDLDTEALLNVDFQSLIDSMTTWLVDRLDQSIDKDAFAAANDLAFTQAKRLEMAAKASQSLFRPSDLEMDQWPLPIPLHPAERRFADQENHLEPQQLRRLIARMAVSIRDAGALLAREAHLESATIKPVDKLQSLTLVLRTRDKNGELRHWSPPPRLQADDHPAALAMARLELALDQRHCVLDIGTKIQEALKNEKPTGENLAAYRALLAQLPHTWGLQPDIKVIDDNPGSIALDVEMGFGVEKGALSKLGKSPVYGLILSPERANLLDRLLLGECENLPGNITFRYRHENHRHTVASSLDRIELHQPIKHVPIEEKAPESTPFVKRMIGIDLGERGVGFDVRELSEGYPLVERGFIAVPAIKKLIKATRRFRKKAQREMAVRRSNVDFSKMREAVAGNVIAVIKQLMNHYQALPVLEDDVSNLDKGNRQLSHVYTAVVAAFTYRGTDTLDAARNNTWRGQHFTHPHVWQAHEIKGKTEYKPLNLFPGTSVKAAGTSQQCSCCGVNATRLINQSSASRFTSDERGVITLNDQSGNPVNLRLFKIASLNHRRETGERAPFPVGSVSITKADLKAHIKKQRRLGPDDPRSKDTAQSLFWCPNINCERHQLDNLLHADINAASNIVMRRLNSLVPIEDVPTEVIESRKKR
jgi:hypothetical protein